LSKNKDITIDELVEMFQDLKRSFPDEFIVYNLGQVSIPLFTPLLKKKMNIWQPFEVKHDEEANSEVEIIDQDGNSNKEITYCCDIYSSLSSLLADVNIDYGSRENSKNKINMKPYHRIVWETWMPSFRKALMNASLKHNACECVDLLTVWSKAIPSWIMENIIDQFVQPKLSNEVDEWNPLTDPIPIHEWVLPWLPLMGERLEVNLFPIIRHKLANALTSWHPSDESAKAILLPWRPPVFTLANWDAFVIKNILPKLELVMEQFVINPSMQVMEPWHWVMAWQELVPTASLVSLLERAFFPKWLQMLSIWLNSTPNYDEVSAWYTGWKGMFSEKLLQHPNIKTKLAHALAMMGRSMSGVQVSYTPFEAQPAASFQQQQYQQPQQPTMEAIDSIKVNNHVVFVKNFISDKTFIISNKKKFMNKIFYLRLVELKLA
jgi:tuftelin-interacting protein 11